MNMVRAGVVTHPLDWPEGGFVETINPRKRYVRLDFGVLVDLLEFDSLESMQEARNQWITNQLHDTLEREPAWTEAVAVGTKSYLSDQHAQLKSGGTERRIRQSANGFPLAEEDSGYSSFLESESRSSS